MEILSIRLNTLRNEEHYKFQIDFSSLVDKATPATLGIQALYTVYQAAVANENVSLDVLRKSAITEHLYDADNIRDHTFSGIVSVVKAAAHHFKPEIKAAALRVQVLLDSYGNIAIKPYDQETASITKFISELQTKSVADVTLLGLTDWLIELKKQNDAFDALKKSRYTEEASKPQQNHKIARSEVDNAYRAIVKRVNALSEVNGPKTYASFITELNQRIEGYSNLLAQRQGRNAKNAAETGSGVSTNTVQ
jgi:hypothetical protein